jgi:hypothetical protein
MTEPEIQYSNNWDPAPEVQQQPEPNGQPPVGGFLSDGIEPQNPAPDDSISDEQSYSILESFFKREGVEDLSFIDKTKLSDPNYQDELIGEHYALKYLGKKNPELANFLKSEDSDIGEVFERKQQIDLSLQLDDTELYLDVMFAKESERLSELMTYEQMAKSNIIPAEFDHITDVEERAALYIDQKVREIANTIGEDGIKKAVATFREELEKEKMELPNIVKREKEQKTQGAYEAFKEFVKKDNEHIDEIKADSVIGKLYFASGQAGEKEAVAFKEYAKKALEPTVENGVVVTPLNQKLNDKETRTAVLRYLFALENGQLNDLENRVRKNVLNQQGLNPLLKESLAAKGNDEIRVIENWNPPK